MAPANLLKLVLFIIFLILLVIVIKRRAGKGKS
jgi:hypothetical protein